MVLSLTFIVSAQAKYTYLGTEISEAKFNAAYDTFKDSLVIAFDKVHDIGVSIELYKAKVKVWRNIKVPEGTRYAMIFDEFYVQKIINKKSFYMENEDSVVVNIDTTGMTNGQRIKKTLIGICSGMYNRKTESGENKSVRRYTAAIPVTKEQFKTYLDSGAALYTYNHDTPCSACNGTGQKKIHNVSSKCPACKGTGQRDDLPITQIKAIPYAMK